MSPATATALAVEPAPADPLDELERLAAEIAEGNRVLAAAQAETAAMLAAAECRMCGDRPSVPCPTCGACFGCAADDCTSCTRRLAFLRAERVR